MIAGDIDLAQTRTLVEKWFGELPRGADVEPVAAAAGIAHRGQAADADRSGVGCRGSISAWLTPRVFAPGDATLDVVSSVLAGGKNSRLYKRLVYDEQMAQDVSALTRRRQPSAAAS